MMTAKEQVRVELSASEVRILVQSLDHCLATCQAHTSNPQAICEDCDAARALKKKLGQLAS